MSKAFLVDGKLDGWMTPVVPFSMAINMQQAPGYSTVDKFGVNPVVDTTSDPEDIWEFGGAYPYDADGTAPIKYLSSSSALDVGQPISVEGLLVDGTLKQQTATTDGQGLVTLEFPLWRVYRMENNSDTLDIQGILYCHTDPSPTAGVPLDANVRAIINGNKNQTLMAVYTIPKGKIGMLFRGELGVELEGNAAALAEYAHLHYESRRYGKLFKVKKALTCLVGGQAVYQDERSFPDFIPAMTDIRLRAEEVSQTMGLWATMDILLVDENKWHEKFLEAIGQPGR